MLGSKNHLFVDRRVYAFKGTWKDPKQDLERLCYYFVNETTLVESYENGRGHMKPQITITVFGEFPICANDLFKLQTDEEFRVQDISYNYFESNVLVRDMLKQKVESMVLILR